MSHLEPVVIGKPGIAFSKKRIRHIAIDFVFGKHLHIVFRMKPAVRRQFGILVNIAIAKHLEILPCPLDHGLEHIMLLGLPEHNDEVDLVNAAVRANIRASVAKLSHGSLILEQLVEAGQLSVVGGEYSIETGTVEFFENEQS